MKRKLTKPGPIATFFEPKEWPCFMASAFSDLSIKGLHLVLSSSLLMFVIDSSGRGSYLGGDTTGTSSRTLFLASVLAGLTSIVGGF